MIEKESYTLKQDALARIESALKDYFAAAALLGDENDTAVEELSAALFEAGSPLEVNDPF